MKTRILFVCHGNICCSPMGEYILRHMAAEAGVSDMTETDSCGVSDEERGNPVYPPARDELRRHGIDCRGHAARKFTDADYTENDLIIAMDAWNMRRLRQVTGNDPEGKIRLLGEYTDGREVDDPWYTGDFGTAYRQIEAGCRRILDEIIAGSADIRQKH